MELVVVRWCSKVEVGQSAADEAVYKVGRCKRAGNICLGPSMDLRKVLSRRVTPVLYLSWPVGGAHIL